MTTNSTVPEMKDRKRLYEISVIRPIIILSLVLNHAFCKISSGGLRSNNYILPDVYQWVNWFNFEATLELFVLISGYLFAFQSITLNRSYSFVSFCAKKARRLLLPMLVFGIVYFFCFLYRQDTFTVTSFLLALLSGCGHLWFLPMLFWCLVLLYILVNWNFDGVKTLICLSVLSFIKYLPLPFGLVSVTHYLFYAFLGYYIYKHKDVLNALSKKKWQVSILWVLYIAFVLLLHSPLMSSFTYSSYMTKVLEVFLTGVVELTACVSGILALYCTVIRFTSVQSFELYPIVKRADQVSFGIYIFHQFILVALYHYTPIVSSVNQWILPWIGFVVALPVSWLLTSLTLHTKIGRYLIG